MPYKIVTEEERGKTSWSLWSNSVVLSSLLIILSRCSWKFDLVSRCIPKCISEGTCCTRLWLKYMESWFRFWRFLENKISWVWLLGLGLKLIFHCIAQSFILLRSLFKLFADVSTSWTTEKREVSLANSLTFVIKSSERSLL